MDYFLPEDRWAWIVLYELKAPVRRAALHTGISRPCPIWEVFKFKGEP